MLESLRGDVQLLREDGFAAEGLDAEMARAATGSSLFAGGIRFPRTPVPLRPLRRRPRGGRLPPAGVRLFEASPVLSIERRGGDHLVRTPRGQVVSRHLFLATNALAPQLLPGLTAACGAERGQVLVTEPLAARPCRGCFGGGLAWWRDIREANGGYRLLFGGARRRDEPDSLFRQYGDNGRPNARLGNGFLPTLAHQRRLHARLAEIFPHLAEVRITHRWAGLQSFTCDGLPVIGALDPERRIYGMAGFSGMGNSYSNVGAAYLADRAAGITGRGRAALRPGSRNAPGPAPKRGPLAPGRPDAGTLRYRRDFPPRAVLPEQQFGIIPARALRVNQVAAQPGTAHSGPLLSRRPGKNAAGPRFVRTLIFRAGELVSRGQLRRSTIRTAAANWYPLSTNPKLKGTAPYSNTRP